MVLAGLVNGSLNMLYGRGWCDIRSVTFGVKCERGRVRVRVGVGVRIGVRVSESVSGG